ncbi:MAG: vanX [Gammaproteobacteria bacterium]|jgi:D-alanyl-D-alanine dipeptidase|nr:vanX [Gammaproteobacteria bacterium]
MKKDLCIKLVCAIGFYCIVQSAQAAASTCLPADFVSLKKIDPTIQQDIRYAGNHNFVGRPIQGYETANCMLTRKTALALQAVQRELRQSGLGLKVYDCYRPQKAVDDFISWSRDPSQHRMKAEFYPDIDKQNFFKLGYVAAKSGHTRGSTVDLTIVALPLYKQAQFTQDTPLQACFNDYAHRFHDNSIDMGTGYDCMDERSHQNNHDIPLVAYYHRQLLKALMEKQGFVPYNPEWWHFTLKNEAYPDAYFNCNI